MFRTCRTSNFCTVAWQLARFNWHDASRGPSIGDSWASCVLQSFWLLTCTACHRIALRKVCEAVTNMIYCMSLIRDVVALLRCRPICRPSVFKDAHTLAGRAAFTRRLLTTRSVILHRRRRADRSFATCWRYSNSFSLKLYTAQHCIVP